MFVFRSTNRCGLITESHRLTAVTRRDGVADPVVHGLGHEPHATVSETAHRATRMVTAPAVATDIARALLPARILVIHRVTQVAGRAQRAGPGTIVGVTIVEDRLVATVPVVVFKHSNGVGGTIDNLGQLDRTTILEDTLQTRNVDVPSRR